MLREIIERLERLKRPEMIFVGKDYSIAQLTEELKRTQLERKDG